MQEFREDESAAGSAQRRLLDAAMELLVERGYRGATSREIARRAGVNEVTLFRLFSTKDDLIAAVLLERARANRRLIPAPTGDLVRDLETLAALVMEALLDDETLTVRILPEMKRLSEAQQAIVREGLDESHEAIMAILRPHQESGELDPELGEDIWQMFVGPLLMRALGVQIGAVHAEFDPRRYVRCFLRGARGPASAD